MVQLICDRCLKADSDPSSLEAMKAGPLYDVVELPQGWENLDGTHLCQVCSKAFHQWVEDGHQAEAKT
jgi:hypothetical protein